MYIQAQIQCNGFDENQTNRAPIRSSLRSSSLHRRTILVKSCCRWPVQPPLFMPVPPPTHPAIAELDAIRSVLKESEKVVERLQKQEENMLQEVTKKAKDLHDKEFKLPNQKPIPCLDERDACFKCYKEHEKDPLNCANVVQNFAECARRVKQQVSLTDK
ncbi:hypothetical protein K7X08_025443 [Anisodus acutangulus]|uniref:Uncharacterized protein n=1 Tax=Anisodus acutangulus TaxID=402998 RepID=A0A9Q1LUX7_9SOLA|nr:hypothetical protein K7X08_025443 [Anisodus acutangulus]